ncbi:hypothetical protein ACEPAF_4599 [Sanghuangporus sanghuang]
MSSFKEYESTHTDCPSGARIFSYHKEYQETDSSLPVLVLLHGYPQNNLLFKDFVDEIPKKWRVLVPDLPGYGNSTKPVSPNSRAHSKREWAKDIIHVVDALFGAGTPIIAFGHDRGARVAYRLALDYGVERVRGAACLDIVPTINVWDAMRLERDHLETRHSHHWITLSAPRPLPETMISADRQRFYYEYMITSWAGPGMKDPSLEWIQDSVNPYLDSKRGYDRTAAACEDYRAGATHDVDDDKISGINPLTRPATGAPPVFHCPLLILYSHHLGRRFDVGGIWRNLSHPDKVTVHQVGDETTGHFIVNERQAETGELLRDWLDTLQL